MAEGAPVGEPIDCINVGEIADARGINDRTVDFRLRSGRIYRNVLENSCPGVGHHAFSYRPTLSRLCSIDTITVMSSGPGVPGPTCGLGMFQQIDREAR